MIANMRAPPWRRWDTGSEMEARPLHYIAEAVDGRLVRGDGGTFVHRLITDSRKVQPEDLFLAVQGDRFDGHDYLEQVVQGGVAAVLVDRPVDADCAVIEVDDTRSALGRFGARYRRDYHLPVVGVAGSNGKTTTKELLASILRRHFAAVWSEASFNNDIGVPLTLLKIENFHHAAVLELGTNHHGELAGLVRMAAPQYGILTSIGREHLEFFGNVEGVAREEGMLGELLPSSGKLFLYGDSEWSKPIAARSVAPVCTVGFEAGNDWRAENVETHSTGISFHAEGGVSGEVRLNLLGRHQATNALLAMAVAVELGVPPDAILAGLAECRAPSRRLQARELGGVCVIDDSYNANADSVAAALLVLADMPCEGRRIAVVGSMAELGDATDRAHEEAGTEAARCGIDVLFSVGSDARVTADAALAAGVAEVEAFDNNVSAGEVLGARVKAGDVVLLKGSRAARLEEVGDYLKKDRK
ncbi:MAG: hypothetical protein CMO66_03575 [Verrucomicrobiales bacterium]|nr:hypothetical protein [Verrucomicrobiales bacterium]